MDHTCIKCKYTLPASLSYSGKHIKASCANCGRYIKFVPQWTIPNFNDTRTKIWALTQDLNIINDLKNKLEFKENLEGVHKNMAYHNLYLEIILTHFS